MNFAARIKNFFSSNAGLPEDFFDKLGDLLIEGDFGAAPAMKIVERLEHIVKKAGINEPAHIKEQLIQLLTDGLLEICPDRQVENIPETITVILLLGVNGTGKTTTAAKLASRYKSMGKKPILAAADTFRAGAIDQLKIHGEKIKVRVVAHQQGGDPAAVVYDAVETSMAGAGVGGGDLIIVDTAGRMHTKTALVEELKKIYRVLENKSNETGTIKCIKWLVLDATTGRNALVQAEIFHEAVSLDGVILTKYDSNARGGIVFSLASELMLPTVFFCDGEGYEHIKPFDKAVFVKDFIG